MAFRPAAPSQLIQMVQLPERVELPNQDSKYWTVPVPDGSAKVRTLYKMWLFSRL